MRAAFTLLETMLAVAILAVVSVAVYRFTLVNVEVARISSQESARQTECAGLARLLQTQLDQLPTREANAFRGVHGKITGDQLRLLCLPGNGLLAQDGPQRLCTWRLNPDSSELGLLRRQFPSDNQNLPQIEGTDPEDPGGGWLPLLSGVQSLEITYFSARQNGWLPRWTDTNALPDLVRVRLTFADGGEDFETTLHVPVRGQTIVNLPVAPVNTTNAQGAAVTPNSVSRVPQRPLSTPQQ